MTTLRVLVLSAAFASLPVLAQAGPFDDVSAGDFIKVTDYHNSNNGGPFNVGYHVDSSNSGKPVNWLTFCIETNEYLYFDKLLKVESVSTEGRLGGAGGSDGSKDALDPRTAYLYTTYRGLAATSDISLNNAYQQAIWYIEQEITSVTGLALQLVNQAQAEVDSGRWVGLGQVVVMNLVWAEAYGGHKIGDRAQDLLAMGPEPTTRTIPDGGTTLMLLGGGLMGLGALRRKLNV